MYSLHLSAEQLEIRDTVRDFVSSVVKPVALKPERLDAGDRSLPMDVLDQASQIGLRTLALSEGFGGAGADALTACLVAEELGGGDADIAAALTETSRLVHLLFDQAMEESQRERFLSRFLEDDRCHLALADHEPETDTRLGINYRRPGATEASIKTIASPAGHGEWVINGAKDCVANAPIAQLFVVEVAMAGRTGTRLVLVPADAPGLTVAPQEKAWHLGTCGRLELRECRIPAGHLLTPEAGALFAKDSESRGRALAQSVNIGIARAAYEAALDYAQVRVQGGRPIVEHQAIGEKLADIATRLEIARAAVWQAAWAADHPEAIANRSLPDLPLALMAQVYTAEAMVEACKDAAEIFGAMGVMRDMPLYKYLRDARMCLSAAKIGDARLRIAEALAGFRRPTARAIAAE
jgi:alkylation response protein AidB-like acyl-CoA dehydrogenase